MERRLTRVERRLKALFWHLAERWGRVSGDGVIVPLALTHRILGQLVGARRPTVSTALSELAERAGVGVRFTDALSTFMELAQQEPAFKGLVYQTIGDQGAMLSNGAAV